MATMVTGYEPIRLPCMGLHESYGVCTQGEHEKKLLQQILSAARSVNNAAVLRKVTSSLATSQKMHPSRGHLKKFA
jgi:hypothetical protein